MELNAFAQHCICKMRADDGTSTAAILQVHFGAGPFTIEPYRQIQLYISNLAFPPGGCFPKPTHFANADRWQL
jgi:hypothetical protein